MKVLTCMGMLILGRSTAQMAILCLSLLLLNLSPLEALRANPYYRYSYSTAKNANNYFALGFRHVKEVNVTAKIRSLANFSSLFQTTMTGL